MYCALDLLGNEKSYNQTLDLGCPKVMSYVEMLRSVAKVMGKKDIFLRCL